MNKLLDIETTIISLMLKHKEIIAIVKKHIKEEFFVYYKEIAEIIYQHDFADIITIKGKTSISYSDLVAISDATAQWQVKNINEYIDLFLEERKKHYLKTLNIERLAEEKTSTEILNDIIETLKYQRVDTKIKTINDCLTDIKEYMQLSVSSISTSYPELDSVLKIKSTNLIIIAARPKVGKSSVALNFSVNFAKQKKKVLYFSFEMSTQEVSYRIACLLSKKIVRSENELNNIKDALKDLDIKIIESAGLTVQEIKTIIINENPDIVVIDQLDCIPTEQRKDRYDLAVGKNVIELKAISMEMKKPIILLHQLNRETAKSDRPELHNLKDSSIVEQKADAVIMLYRKDENQHELVMRIGANRMGASKSILFDFDASTCELIERGEYLFGRDLPF